MPVQYKISPKRRWGMAEGKDAGFYGLMTLGRKRFCESAILGTENACK